MTQARTHVHWDIHIALSILSMGHFMKTMRSGSASKLQLPPSGVFTISSCGGDDSRNEALCKDNDEASAVISIAIDHERWQRHE